jgi:hypothetical protein
MDFNLKTVDEKTMNSLLVGLGILEENLTPAQNVSVDIIGSFIRDEKEYTDWHVNLRFSETSEDIIKALQPYVVEPVVPYRVWA